MSLLMVEMASLLSIAVVGAVSLWTQGVALGELRNARRQAGERGG